MFFSFSLCWFSTIFFSVFLVSTIFFSVFLVIFFSVIYAPRHLTSPTHKTATTHSSTHNTPPPLPTTPYLLIPAPTFATSTPHTHPQWNFCSLLLPKYSSQSFTDTREGVCITRVLIPNLDALPILASVSFRKNLATLVAEKLQGFHWTPLCHCYTLTNRRP